MELKINQNICQLKIKRSSGSSFDKFYMCVYIFFANNNLIVHTKLERWLLYFKYNLLHFNEEIKLN